MSAPVHVRACKSGKLLYLVRQDAERARQSVKRRGGGTPYVYRCPDCVGYHLSQSPPRHTGRRQ